MFNRKDVYTPIHFAALNGHIGIVDHLKKLGQDIGVKSNNGSTPMHFAARNGQIDMVDHLMELGQDIGVKNNDKDTSMHFAAFFNQRAMVHHLKKLNGGGNDKVTKREGWSNQSLHGKVSGVKSMFLRKLKTY